MDVNNFHGLVMSQKFPINGFKWVENEDLIKRYNEESDSYLKLIFNIEKNCISSKTIYHFHKEE